MFVEYTPMSGQEVILDNNNHVDVVGIGKIKLQLTTGKVLTLENVFHMPEIRRCCVSVLKLTKNKLNICLNHEGAVITKGQDTVGVAYREDELFRLSIIEENQECENKKLDTESKKVVLDEIIGLIVADEDPVLSLNRSRGWYLMTRCTKHVCKSRDMFVKYTPLSNHELIMDNDDHVDVAGFGTVILCLTSGKVLTLINVLHMPAIIKCCVSIPQLTEIGYCVTFRRTGAVIEEDDDVIIGEAYREDGGLFRVSIMEEHEGWVKVHNETLGLVDEEDNNSSSRDWYLNSRSRVQICNSWDMFLDYHLVSGREVIMGNNGPVDVTGFGSVVLKFT